MAGTNGEVVEEKAGYKNGSLLPGWPVDQQQTPPAQDEDPQDSEGMSCGLGPCKPAWIQFFASKQAFLVTFCIAWVLQGIFYTYFVSVITTIEKLFQLQSKTTGFIMSATEIGQIGSSLLLTYYGGQGHRPKWIACGMIVFAVSAFACSMPHFIFGKQMLSDSASPVSAPNVCHLPWEEVTTLFNYLNYTQEQCQEEYLAEQRIQSKITTIVLGIFFISLLGVGMGQTAVYTLGIPFIDDNVASRESPLYVSITIGVRILGPALGFLLGSFCTRLYVDLGADTHLTPTDPRWVGAWWLGLVFISVLLMLSSLAMFSFPKQLATCRPVPSAKVATKKQRDPPTKNPSLRDFPKAVKKLLRNDILMFRTASSVLHILPIAGLYTFLPKYLESQFRLTAHLANMVSGVGGIMVMGLGIILSGVFILRVKPNARFVAGWIAFTAVLYAIGMGILMFVGCPMNDFAGLRREHSVSIFEPACETDCLCDTDKFSPICGEDGQTYYSSCHAGCTNMTVINGTVIGYSDCLCIGGTGGASVGYCELECGNFTWYILLFSLFVFIHATSEVGSMLLILRCVDPTEKAMALGLIQFAIGLFGNVPCPIIYGAVVDSACLIWETICGKQGACKLYDENFFRMFYHGTTGAILLCAFLVDIIVWYKAGSVNFEEDEGAQEEELNPFTARSRSETSV